MSARSSKRREAPAWPVGYPSRNPVSFAGFCPVRQNGKAEDCGPQYTAGSIPTLARAAPKATHLGLMRQGANGSNRKREREREHEANVAPPVIVLPITAVS